MTDFLLGSNHDHRKILRFFSIIIASCQNACYNTHMNTICLREAVVNDDNSDFF